MEELFETKRKGLGGHQSARMGKDEWLTPPEIIDALGPFDLDPCSPVNRPWPTAKNHFTILDDGLSKTWEGRVWLNPPYGRLIGRWLWKMAMHKKGIALVFARTETSAWYKTIWPYASAVCFLRGRLHFYHATGQKASANSGAPSALVSYGYDDYLRLSDFAQNRKHALVRIENRGN